MRKLFATVAAFLLFVALVIQAQEPDGKAKGKGKGKGGFVPKNLQVLAPGTFPAAMQSFVQSLGLADQGACSYCHVEDRASDEKMQKLTATSPASGACSKPIAMRFQRDGQGRYDEGRLHLI